MKPNMELPPEIAKNWIPDPVRKDTEFSTYWVNAVHLHISLIYCVQRWTPDDRLHHVQPGEFIIFNWKNSRYTIASTDPCEVVADFVAKLLFGEI